jgi:hypothetical protein
LAAFPDANRFTLLLEMLGLTKALPLLDFPGHIYATPDHFVWQQNALAKFGMNVSFSCRSASCSYKVAARRQCLATATGAVEAPTLQ